MSPAKSMGSIIEKAAQRLRTPESEVSTVERAAKRVEQAAVAPAFVPEPIPATARERAPVLPPAPVAPPPVQPAAAAPAVAPAPAGAPPGDRGRTKTVELDLVRLQLAGFVTPNSDRTRLVEEYRIIKRPLLLRAAGPEAVNRGNLIMVTSSQPEDGKTFTAINLAMSMASERDLNVLLVDADMHRQQSGQSAMGVLGVQDQLGLLDVLANPKMDLSEVLLRTNVPNLTLLPAGSFATHPTELMASQRMEEVITGMARRYRDRVIVIDTPPVLSTSESSVLAMHVGQIVFVVEAERTSRRAIESSLALLSRCPHINLVLNKAKADAGERFGEGYYTD
jgi:receptor protein-tyrosine kinase